MPRLHRTVIGAWFRVGAAAFVSAITACRPSDTVRSNAALPGFRWAPDEERYEAQVEAGDELVLQTIPATGLVMLGRIDGEPGRFVGYDPAGAVFVLLDDAGTVLRTRGVDEACRDGCSFSGGVRGTSVFLGATTDGFNQSLRWDLRTDDISRVPRIDDEADDPFEDLEPCVPPFSGLAEVAVCDEGVMPHPAPRVGAGYLRVLDAFARGGNVYIATPSGLAEIHDGRADWTRCRTQPSWRVSDRFGVRVIDGESVCDAERGVLARGFVQAVSANGRFVLLAQGDDSGEPLRYFLFDAASGTRTLDTFDAPTTDASADEYSDPVSYRPFLSDDGRFFVLVPSGFLTVDEAIVTVDLREGRVARLGIRDAERDDEEGCSRDPVRRGNDVYSGGCGHPAYRVSLMTGEITPVSQRPTGAFETPPIAIEDQATTSLVVDGLDLHLGPSEIRFVSYGWQGGDRIGVIERRGDHVVVDAKVEVGRFSRRTGATTPLRSR